MTLTLSYYKGHNQHIDIIIMIGAQPMLTYTVLYTYILCHICNVTLASVV